MPKSNHHPPSQVASEPAPPQPASPTVRHGVLRNAATFSRGQETASSSHLLESTIPPLADFDDNMDDGEDEDQFDEKELTADEIYQNTIAGRWGEGPSKVDVVDAERDFRKLERSLTQMSRRSSAGPAEPPVIRRRGARNQQKHEQTGPTQEEQIDLEGGFNYEAHLKDSDTPGDQSKVLKKKAMGVCWKQLSVVGESPTERFITTTGDPFMALFHRLNPFFWIRRCAQRKPPANMTTKTILYPMDGCCQEGEMILVLGRPGSGCSTLLRVLANDRKNYKKVLGEVTYNHLSAETVAKHYKGEVLYNQEDDFHYPTLTVRETLETAIKAKTPRARLPEMERRKDFRDIFLDVLTKMYGLARQKDTLVGNAFIRGLSGGERKRLSIAEQMATRSSINMWDGSTRGLDASSALDYVKSLRVQTNLLRRATLVSIYQASENIYDLFDKVLLLYDGRCIYFGPTELARQYFIELGFYSPPRQTTADFLTAITEPRERKIDPGAHPNIVSSMPTTPEQFEALYKQSTIYEDLVWKMQKYEAQMTTNRSDDSQEATEQNKQEHVSSRNPYTITYWDQIWAMTIRQVQMTKGNYTSLISRYVTMVIKAVIVGTCFLLLPTTSNGAFTRGGVLFFSLLFNTLISQAELPQVFQGRPVLYKLKHYAMYRPSSFGLAQIVVDIPIILVQTLLFSVVLYFLAGLQRTPGKFFFFVLVMTLNTLCMTSFCRMWGCTHRLFPMAAQNSGFILLVFVLYSGYMVPYQNMHPWFIWIFWVNPLAYAFKALMSNEMSGLRFSCDGSFLIPNGPGYTDLNYQVCTLAGAKPGRDYVDGPDYLYTSFRYRVSEMWLDVLGVFFFWILFSVLAVWAMDINEFGKGGFSTNVFERPNRTSARVTAGAPVEPDVEQGQVSNTHPSTDASVTGDNILSGGVIKDNLVKGSTLTWEDLDYFVSYSAGPSGKKQLLTKVAGIVKPGTMTALMGSTGSGKTTLLDILAQRKSIGTVTGQIEVDGLPLRRDFQRTTGYCEQVDMQVPECTVREALQFSARLRQPAEVSETEKDAYVEEIIRVLELENIADAIIGTTESGIGISVEERKRVNIGAELVAKPKLLFLDEPTSGLDAQASYSIIRFMRKLANQGQAILCTVHQPSSQLFAFFDDLLLLANDGCTVFFGELGPDATGLLNYFEKNGAPTCAADANPAEYILDVVNARRTGLNWPEIWNRSPERVQLLEEIQNTRTVLGSCGIHDSPVELEYATNTLTQFKYVFSRMSKTFWRLPGYNFGRLGMLVMFALLNAFTFYQLGDSLADLQSRVFVAFQVLVVCPLLANAVQPRIMLEREWFLRETASKYYSWRPFALTVAFIELPVLLFAATVFFCILYWTVGFTTDSVSTFYSYLMLVILFFFSITLGQMIASWTPSLQIAAMFNTFAISTMNLFSGIVMPYAIMPKFWRSWLYWINPYHYIVEGLVTSQLNNLKVHCSDTEYSVFQPPSGQTCLQYASAFLERTGMGYLNNPNATAGCQYCQFSNGEDFYSGLNMDLKNRWRNLGIACAFLLSNFLLIVLGVRVFKGNKR